MKSAQPSNPAMCGTRNRENENSVDWSELRSCVHKELHFVFGEFARLLRLEHEHAFQETPMRYGDAEERVERIFSSFAEILKSRVIHCVFDHLRPNLFAHQAYEPFAEPHSNFPDAVRI